MIVRWPTISNLDEFAQLSQVVNIEWAEHPSQLGGADMIVLPGSKHVASDLEWLRANGFEAPLLRSAQAGTPIIGICGGMQILGEEIVDPHGVDGSGLGLGLLPLTTVFGEDKLVANTRLQFSEVPGPWHPLSGIEFDGYDIRHGRATPTAEDKTTDVLSNNAGFVADNVIGIATHGLLEDSTALAALFGVTPEESLDAALDRVADIAEHHLDMTAIDQLAGLV